MPDTTIEIHELSVRSLRLVGLAGYVELTTATGFIVEHDGVPYLITNRHVATARDPRTGEPLHPELPEQDSLAIYHHAEGQLGSWLAVVEPLYHPDGSPRWLQHPDGLEIDVIALPLNVSGEPVDLHSFPLHLSNVDAVPEPAMPVSIIGFPLGLAVAGSLPIWKTGHIASDPAIDFDGKPAFLIDATTRGGMSGSPVVLKAHGGYRTSDGRRPMRDITKFLGIYSGRIHRDSEVGIVWKPHVIKEILSAGTS